MQFDSPPSTWSAYARVLTARKPACLPPGATLARIEARQTRVHVDPAHLARYREVCGIAQGNPALPIAYPHVLASPLHLALLSSDSFPVRLLGLVHVRNVIEQHRAPTSDDGGDLCTWIEGYRDTPRGQEFDLHTEWLSAGECIWRETCTFLARAARPRTPESAEGGVAAAPTAADRAPSGPLRTSSLRAPAGLGRSYALVSGDFNPIHLSDASARLFGFRAAIAHGMWSAARCAAELPTDACAGAVRYEVEFRAPVFLPAWLMLQQSTGRGVQELELRDGQGERVHLRGALRSLR